MGLKFYISLLLIPLFLLKLLVIDSNGMSFFMGEDISVVHPYCTKEKVQDSGEKMQNFSQVSTEDQFFTVKSFCPTQFDFEIFSWEMQFSEDIHTQNAQFSSRLSKPYLEHTSPPPRFI